MIASAFFLFATVGCQSQSQAQSTIDESVYHNLPFSMPKVQQTNFPNYSVSIVDFGAKSGGIFLNTEAINNAIKAVNTCDNYVSISSIILYVKMYNYAKTEISMAS